MEGGKLIPPKLLDEIRTDPFLNYLYKRVLQFDKYLDSTSHLKIHLKGLEYDLNDTSDAPDPAEYQLDYHHRWTKINDNLQVWRLYNTQYYFELNPDKTPKYTMMITLTGTHASPRNPKKCGLNHMAYLGKFHEAHRKEKNLIRKYIKTDLSLSMLEGHPESGYAHAHDLYFLNELPTQKTIDALLNYWDNRLGMGSAKHGMEIVINEPKNFSEIKSFIAYPLAYVGKTTIGDLPEWSKYDVIFNTCLWLSPRPKALGGIGCRVRAVQPSRALSKIMNHPSYPTKPKRAYKHVETSFSDEKQNMYDPYVVYRSPSYDNDIGVWKALGGGDDTPDVPMDECHLEEFLGKCGT